jgi:S-DNA-T family DNA segregation ATPase FtsK/SpoIIIE
LFLLDIWVFPLFSISKKPAITDEWRQSSKTQERLEAQKERKERLAAREGALAQVRSFARGTFADALALVAAVMLCFSAIALGSYSSADPGFTSTGTQTAHNMCGLVGAWIADFGYWMFGLSVWWIVIGLFAILLLCIRGRIKWKSGEPFELRICSALIGLLVLICSSVGLETIQLAYLSEHLSLGPGGLLGRLMADKSVPYLGIWGATLIFSVVGAVGLSYVFRFSWLDLCEEIGELIDKCVLFIVRMACSIAQGFRRPEPEPVEPALLQGAEQAQTVQEAGQGDPAAAETEVIDVPFSEGEEASADELGGEVRAAPAEQEPAKPRQPEAAEAPKPRRTMTQGELLAKEQGGHITPNITALAEPPQDRRGITEETIEMTSRLIESKLRTYRIKAEVKGAQAGPVITQYWLQLADGVKGSHVEAICKDLTRALAVHSIRVVPAIPNTPYMGLEIPNGVEQRMAVYLSEVIGCQQFKESKSLLSLALGKDIAGKPLIIDLARMPHMLVGGTTGSGKSVCINSMILSLLYKCDPSQLRLVLIDPKTVEFSLYQDIPHLLTPVVTDMNKAANALAWLVNEMDRRYRLMSRLGVRSFDSFNFKVKEAIDAGAPLMDPFDVDPDNPAPHVPLKPLPYLVCFIDELADLILVNRKQVELYIMRLAQKARAAGIHLVLATQRPSADIVTPLIKANIVARICFQVASRFDSMVVLDESGAQDLLGRGDMLFRKPGTHALIRAQGCVVEETEIDRVVQELRSYGEPEYVEGVTDPEPSDDFDGDAAAGGGKTGEKDPLYDEAVQLVLETRRVSTSFVQRRFSIGYNRAANIIETMEAAGIVSPANAAGKREILAHDAGGV